MFTGIIERKAMVISNVNVNPTNVNAHPTHLNLSPTSRGLSAGGSDITTSTEAANRLVISSAFEQLQTGESIAINGVCLTLLPSETTEMSFDVSPETLNKTTLGDLLPGAEVNLERAMLASTRFGGHYVSGHVDAMAKIHSIKQINEYTELELSGFDANAMLYLIPKGSITVEGVSLTINEVANQSIKLMLVPHTLLNTTLCSLKVGQKVNIEFDYLTRIVAHQLKVAGTLNSNCK